VAVDPDDSSRLLAASNHDQIIAQSRDAGSSWRIVNRLRKPGLGFRVIAFAPSDPRTVFAGVSAYFSAGSFDNTMKAGGVQISIDGGTTWRDANDNLSRSANVSSLAVDENNPKIVYAGTLDRGVLKSTNAGGRWVEMNRGLPSGPRVLSILLTPGKPKVLLAGIDRGGVYRSIDEGRSWQASSGGMNPEASVADLVFDPTSAEVLYAADISSGVYRSEDGGISWRPVNNGLRTRAVNALTISADGRRLYAATEGEGVFRLDMR
jgi:photosystem II stability/assembly factor-like uncharacterized protein